MVKKTKNPIEHLFLAKGIVYGKYWGGGSGWYPARQYNSPSKKGLFGAITKDFQTGGIDSGMGYEKILGAKMQIEHRQSRFIGKNMWVRRTYSNKTLGQWKRLPKGTYF